MTIFAGINAAGYNKDATTERQNCCPGAQLFFHCSKNHKNLFIRIYPRSSAAHEFF